MKHIKWFIDLLVVYWQNIEAGKSQKSHAVLVTMFLSEKSQRKNVASWKLKVDCRSRKMSLLFCQFLSAVGSSEQDCRHIFKQCRLSPISLGRPRRNQ